MELPIAGRGIVGGEPVEDVAGRVGLAHRLGGPADHKAQLHLVVELLGHARVDVVEGAGEAGGLLVEPSLWAERATPSLSATSRCMP